MDPRPNTLIALLAAIALTLAAFGSGYLAASGSREASAASDDSREAIRLITEAFDKIRSTAVDPPDDGVLALPSPLAIGRNAPNAEAARIFVDFILSPEGQQVLVDRHFMPVRSDISPPAGCSPRPARCG